ncbi:phospholipase D regulator KNAG_0C04060 [Huiozyma naganishii CBS 8797]|uniref:Uncharacterized protein n=1 Tax=Huiozyma naganishii (strain ATCC MYA-139 / BCRC 22969 / CBS 8797 / KCTC 17520 / NBRC 10181 / NCYC 3082 / Yp74L-3) TaxID=1071383 RepID=J7S4X0_HUIN7|nr:hypothetical protein KNAG_0C04060 [Kazachstania naganishii CBS 8797]CCK69509.1 hypothetical protein KNAG_0C04060 [Kazachstania naganishii CBS 8797]
MAGTGQMQGQGTVSELRQGSGSPAGRHDGESSPQRGGGTLPQGDSRNLDEAAFYPTTVPPFYLEEQLHNMEQTGHLVTGGGAARDERTTESRWLSVLDNIGSNVNYVDGQKVNLFDQRSSVASSSMNSFDRYYDAAEKERIKNEILSDLDTPWDGDKRLEELFSIPILGKYNFKNQKDKEDWLEFVDNIKQSVYNPDYKGKFPGDEDEDLEFERGLPLTKQDWQKQLEFEKKRWRRYKERKIRKLRPKVVSLLIHNQYVPLAFRFTIGVVALISLALAVRVFQNSNVTIEVMNRSLPQQPSTIMAICVNSIAVFYTIFIAWDEFTGKPLGLREPLSKLRIILLDLLFIIFTAATLALAFNTKFDDQWVCSSYFPAPDTTDFFPSIPHICRKQKALSSFLFIEVFFWVLAFIGSMIKIVERASSKSARG